MGTSLVDVQNAHLLSIQRSIIVTCINELFFPFNFLPHLKLAQYIFWTIIFPSAEVFTLGCFCWGYFFLGGGREQLVFCWESRQIKQVFVPNIMHCRDSSVYVWLVDPLRYNLQTKSVVSTSFLLQILISKKLLFL